MESRIRIGIKTMPIHPEHCQKPNYIVGGVADPDPVPFCPPGSGMDKKWMNVMDEQPG